MMKRDPRQQRWYCITEDECFSEDFFTAINETGCRYIKILYSGSTSHFIINLLSILRKNINFAANLSDLQDELLDEGFEGAALEKELFQRYQDLYEPSFFYFFDTDRIHDGFYPIGQSEAKRHQEKLVELNRYASDNKVQHFYLIPSFPCLTTFVWQMSSYMRTNSIAVVDEASLIPTFIDASRQEDQSTNSLHEHRLENSHQLTS
jgi:hypothetical protein